MIEPNLADTENSSQAFNPKDDKFLNCSIEQDPEDIQPYTILDNSFIRDASISIECYWLISYLLSNKPGWRINVRQLVNHQKKGMSRNKIYRAIKEAIELGYMKKEFLKRGNLNCGIKYIIARTPKFKKCFRHSKIGDTEAGVPENGYAKEQYSEEQHSKEKKYKKDPPSAPSADAVRLLSLFLLEITKNKPDFNGSTNSWPKIFDGLLKRYSFQRIIDVIKFAFTSEFWSKEVGIVSPNIIKNKFEMLETQMRAKLLPKESSGGENKVTWAKELCNRINDDSKFEVLSTYVEIKNKNHVYSILFKEKDFKQLVINHLGNIGIKYD